MSSKAPIEILNVLLCDEVRTEDNGKQILIGVYSGDILVGQIPTQLSLSLWINGRADQEGDWPISVQFALGDGEPAVGIEGRLGSKEKDGFLGIGLPKLPVQVTGPSTLHVRWKIGSGDWETLITKRIRLRGDVGAQQAPTASRPRKSASAKTRRR